MGPVGQCSRRSLARLAGWLTLTLTLALTLTLTLTLTLELQAVPAAERTRLQATELRQVARLRSLVTGPIARVAYLLLPGGMAAWWVTSSVASLAAKLHGAV